MRTKAWLLSFMNAYQSSVIDVDWLVMERSDAPSPKTNQYMERLKGVGRDEGELLSNTNTETLPLIIQE